MDGIFKRFDIETKLIVHDLLSLRSAGIKEVKRGVYGKWQSFSFKLSPFSRFHTEVRGFEFMKTIFPYFSQCWC